MLERHSFSTSQFASTDTTLIGGEASVAGLTVKKRKTSNEGKIDLQMRHRLKQSKGSERLSLFLDLNDEFNNATSLDLTEGAKTFVRQSMKPLIKCYKEYCDYHANVFISKHGEDFSHSKFKCKHASV